MFFLYRPIIRWAARRELVGHNRDQNKPDQGRFTRTEVDHYIDQAWRRYKALAPSLPEEPTVGSRMNVKLATLTISIFKVLLGAGIERAYTIELVSDMTWKVYRQWGRIGQFLVRILPRSLLKPMRTDSARRIQKDGTLAQSFPFNPPGYIAKYVPMKGAIAFDMIRCPVAEVFRAHGAIDLCQASWCDLDYALAEMQGLRLHRTTTLVEGADRCDFRFIPASQVAKVGSSDGYENERPSQGEERKVSS
jgi:L-2-amino-thiazoline-4-carboxylic acid hydrolase-like protein